MNNFLSFVLVIFLSLIFVLPAQSIQEVTDQRINMAINSQLQKDRLVDAKVITVHTFEGVVTLRGTVDNLFSKKHAQQVAESVRGVRGVVNLIVVEPVIRKDETILADIKAVLTLDPNIEANEVTLVVKNGIVTLTGKTASYAAYSLIENAIESIRGVRGIDNQLTYDYQTDRSDNQIKKDIEQLFKMSPYIDEKLIKINVQNGKVFLQGEVGSTAERAHLFRRAWVLGTFAVDASGVTVNPALADQLERTHPVTASDTEIEEALKTALALDPRTNSKIGIEVNNGNVILQGTVKNLMSRFSAAQDAESIVGVWSVDNQLKVVSPQLPQDFKIAKYVKDMLMYDPVLGKYGLDAEVKNGSVKLFGEVETWQQKRRAGELVSNILGVNEIQNNLIYPQREELSDQQLKEAVENEFFWDPYVDPDDITVKVNDGVVVLEGNLSTLHEYRAAIRNAYETNPVNVVDMLLVNDIEPHSPADYYEHRYKMF